MLRKEKTLATSYGSFRFLQKLNIQCSEEPAVPNSDADEVSDADEEITCETVLEAVDELTQRKEELATAKEEFSKVKENLLGLLDDLQ